MNSTVIDPVKLRKIKTLSLKIESLTNLQTMLGTLTPREALKLENKTNKLIKIIKTL